MATDLNALAQALQSGVNAQAKMGGLQQRMKSAQAMADTPYATIDRSTGYGSPLLAIANALRKDRGAKQMREMQPEMDALQQQIGAAQTASTMYGHHQDADQRQWERGADERALAKARKQLEQRREIEGGDITGTGKTYMTPDRSRFVTVFNTQAGPVNERGEPVDLTGMVPYGAEAKAGKGGGGGSGKDEVPPQDILPTLAAEFQDSYANPWDIPLAGSASNLAAREAGPWSTDLMKERQRWWSNFKGLYENPLRHELFGSALTAGEQTQWANSMINPNMDAQQIRDKLNDLMRLNNVQQERMEAMNWLQANPDDPNAAGVRARLSAELGRKI